MKALTTIGIAIVSLLTISSPSIATHRSDPVWPPQTVATTSNPVQGQPITYTITMAGSCSTSELLYLSATSGVLNDLPSSITVPAGETTVQVTATVNSSATGYLTVGASNSQGSAYSHPKPIGTR